MPSPRVIDLVYSDDGEYGWTVRSPQVPGLIGGRETLQELEDEIRSLLAFAGVNLESARIRRHIERNVPVPAGEITVRVAGDGHHEERYTTALRLAAALGVPAQQEQLLSVPRTVTGEILYICVVPSDTVEWIVEQLGPEGDAAAVAMNVAEQMLFSTHFVSGEAAAEFANDGAPTLASLGFSIKTTMAEIARGREVGSAPRRVVVPV